MSPIVSPISDLLSLEKAGDSGGHKMLTWPVFPAKLDTKKPANTGDAGHFIHKVKVEPAGV